MCLESRRNITDSVVFLFFFLNIRNTRCLFLEFVLFFIFLSCLIAPWFYTCGDVRKHITILLFSNPKAFTMQWTKQQIINDIIKCRCNEFEQVWNENKYTILDVLVYNIAVSFTSSAEFWRAHYLLYNCFYQYVFIAKGNVLLKLDNWDECLDNTISIHEVDLRCSSLWPIWPHSQKTNNLFWPDENRLEQCFAANIVQCCRSTIFSSIVDPELACNHV